MAIWPDPASLISFQQHMFSWIPIHEETAERLLAYENRQQQLIDILHRMKAADLKAMPLTDRDASMGEAPMEEIDPFTFLANFNRPITVENRRALWAFLKQEWKLAAEIPEDFDGLPVMNPQRAWFLPYAHLRHPDHVPALWKFFRHLVDPSAPPLDTALMQACLDFNGTAMTILTMGMFWVRPDQWISTDGRNIAYAGQLGSTLLKPKTAADYPGWLTGMQGLVNGNAKLFSLKAYQSAGGVGLGPPFDRLFGTVDPQPVFEQFAEVLEMLTQSSGFKQELLVTSLRQEPCLRINYGDWAVFSYERKGDFRYELILPESCELPADWRPSSEFSKPTAAGKSRLCWASADSVEENPLLWEAFLEHLPQVVAAFAHHRGSQYLRYHRPEIHEMIVSPETRGRYLKEGLPIAEDPLPAEGGRRYWLIAPGDKAVRMEECLEKGIITVGWEEVENVHTYQSREEIKPLIRAIRPDRNPEQSSQMIWKFAHEVREGDIVIAKKGIYETAGWGVVQGGYRYDESRGDHRHLRDIDWKSGVIVKMEGQLPQKTLTEKTDDAELLAELAKAYEGFPFGTAVKSIEGKRAYTIDEVLEEIFIERPQLEKILRRLRDKKNIILQGAPGVGKTFIARRLAHLQIGQVDDSRIGIVQFHQSFAYEDFVEGLRPLKETGGFEVKPGIFRTFCERAASDRGNDYFLIIDEINRGNLSKILGELMMLIETDKRDQSLMLTYSGDPFFVPSNVHLIGTMNTADRSLSMVDYALRRRFSFLNLNPGFATAAFRRHLAAHGIGNPETLELCRRMEDLNARIANDSTLGNGYRIGHSFFTPTCRVGKFTEWYADIVEHEILPLLEEYWVDDPEEVSVHRVKLAEGF